MAKVKPNDSCPCGSGKKFKKCCDSVPTEIPLKSQQTNPPKVELNGTWGISGTEINLSILRKSNDPNNAMNAAEPGGVSGKYKVSFVLSRPKHAPTQENYVPFSFVDDVKGDSHLFLGLIENSDDVIFSTFEIKHPEGNFLFLGYANEKGYLSKIEIEEIEALDFKDAVIKAHNALAPTLSRISLLSDIPLYIYSTTVEELATRNYMSSFSLPYVGKPCPIFSAYEPDRTEFKFASLYREALNSNSPNYQFLCFYKIIEGIRKIRAEKVKREGQEMIAKGEKPVREKEIIPKEKNEQIAWLNFVLPPQKWSDLALSQIFPQEAHGRKVNDLINSSQELDTVRNKIAHAVMRDETKETFSIDDALDASEVMKWLPFCKCLTIYLLKKEYPKLFNV